MTYTTQVEQFVPVQPLGHERPPLDELVLLEELDDVAPVLELDPSEDELVLLEELDDVAPVLDEELLVLDVPLDEDALLDDVLVADDVTLLILDELEEPLCDGADDTPLLVDELALAAPPSPPIPPVPTLPLPPHAADTLAARPRIAAPEMLRCLGR